MEQFPEYTLDYIICKEKLGRLEFQGGPNFKNPFVNHFYYARVGELRSFSTKICEKTGKSGILREINGHFYTLSEAEFTRLQVGPIQKT